MKSIQQAGTYNMLNNVSEVFNTTCLIVICGVDIPGVDLTQVGTRQELGCLERLKRLKSVILQQSSLLIPVG